MRASWRLGIAVLLLWPVPVLADDYGISIKDHQFVPADLTVPANQKVKVTIKNLDPTPAEFESYDLNREKVVGANSEIIVFIGPLGAGHYEFFDDFRRDTTKGTITVK